MTAREFSALRAAEDRFLRERQSDPGWHLFLPEFALFIEANSPLKRTMTNKAQPERLEYD
jgi:hypothetical protein